MKKQTALPGRMRAWAMLCVTVVSAALVASACSGSGDSTNSPPGSTPSKLSATTSSLPSGQVGVSYSATLAATGGTPPYQWTLTAGALPAGLSLTASTGAIAGTPTTAANAAFSVQVKDSGSPAQTSLRSLTITVLGLTISPATLPAGQVGKAYSATLTASGGTAPYRWSITGGTLPSGLSLASATGVISGTPTGAASSASVTFQVTDSSTHALTKSATFDLSIASQALAITTTALATGEVGTPYTATLSAVGGTAPLTWSVAAGTLPAGLSLNSATGAITGTPTAVVTPSALTFKVQDSGSPKQSATAALTLSVSPAGITVTVAPKAAGVTVSQVTTLSAATNDVAGVRWSISPTGGSFSTAQTLNGVKVTFTAPSSAGVYTVTATSVTDPNKTASLQVGVTNLPGVFTYHNDTARDGVNAQEYALSPANVGTATFGKLFSCTVDGAIYTQPLWVANLTIGSARHNVVFVATAHDSLYAFDADASPCVQLWSVSLIDANHGGTTGETTVASGTVSPLVGNGNGDITPETGVIGTPVIDPSTGTLYVVSKSVTTASGPAAFYQRLHAIDVTTGSEKTASPIVIAGTYPGTGDSGVTDGFYTQQELQRTGLALVGGVVYVAWASHEDKAPYYGWLMGYSYGSSGFTQTAVLNVTPNVGYGGIWMGGGAPAVDPNGFLYLITGNGDFDATSGSAPNNDYGDSLLKLAVNASPSSVDTALSISSYFTPSDQATDNSGDHDFGSGGAAVLADVVAGSTPALMHLIVGGGKDGSMYVLNRDNLGGLGDSHAFQKIALGHGIFSTTAFWNDTIYVAPLGGQVTSYFLDAMNTPVEFVLQSKGTSPAAGFGFPGSTPSVSAIGTTNGVVWALDNSQYCTNQSKGCGPAVLHAYDATSLDELWNSTLAAGSADTAGNAVKFCVPTVANGKVYVGTRGNNIGGAYQSTSVSGELDVYGLKP